MNNTTHIGEANGQFADTIHYHGPVYLERAPSRQQAQQEVTCPLPPIVKRAATRGAGTKPATPKPRRPAVRAAQVIVGNNNEQHSTSNVADQSIRGNCNVQVSGPISAAGVTVVHNHHAVASHPEADPKHYLPEVSHAQLDWLTNESKVTKAELLSAAIRNMLRWCPVRLRLVLSLRAKVKLVLSAGLAAYLAYATYWLALAFLQLQQPGNVSSLDSRIVLVATTTAVLIGIAVVWSGGVFPMWAALRSVWALRAKFPTPLPV